jgi:hypothetical protein
MLGRCQHCNEKIPLISGEQLSGEQLESHNNCPGSGLTPLTAFQCCAGCLNVLELSIEIAGCIVYCENCEVPHYEPCETCRKIMCKGDCCMCEFCVERRAGRLEIDK